MSRPPPQFADDWAVQEDRPSFSHSLRIGEKLQCLSNADIYQKKRKSHSQLWILPGRLQASNPRITVTRMKSEHPELELNRKVRMTGTKVTSKAPFLILKLEKKQRVSVQAIVSDLVVFGSVEQNNASSNRTQNTVWQHRGLSQEPGTAIDSDSASAPKHKNHPVVTLSDDDSDAYVQHSMPQVKPRARSTRRSVARKVVAVDTDEEGSSDEAHQHSDSSSSDDYKPKPSSRRAKLEPRDDDVIEVPSKVLGKQADSDDSNQVEIPKKVSRRSITKPPRKASSTNPMVLDDSEDSEGNEMEIPKKSTRRSGTKPVIETSGRKCPEERQIVELPKGSRPSRRSTLQNDEDSDDEVQIVDEQGKQLSSLLDDTSDEDEPVLAQPNKKRPKSASVKKRPSKPGKPLNSDTAVLSTPKTKRSKSPVSTPPSNVCSLQSVPSSSSHRKRRRMTPVKRDLDDDDFAFRM